MEDDRTSPVFSIAAFAAITEIDRDGFWICAIIGSNGDIGTITIAKSQVDERERPGSIIAVAGCVEKTFFIRSSHADLTAYGSWPWHHRAVQQIIKPKPHRGSA